MAGESRHKSGDDQCARDRHHERVLRTVDDLVDDHIARMQRWLTTWGRVDHSHIKRLAVSTCETGDGRETVLTLIPVLDAMQAQAERQVSIVIERVEHLVTLCNNKMA